jgi:hypothetical protein
LEITILATPEDVSLRIVRPDGAFEAQYENGFYKETGSINHYAIVSAGTHTAEFTNESGEGNGTSISMILLSFRAIMFRMLIRVLLHGVSPVSVSVYRMEGASFILAGSGTLDGDPPLLSSNFEVII